MSRKAFPILSHNNEGIKIVAGTFQCNAGAAPDILIGNGWTVARTDAGKYTVTLAETFQRCVALHTSIGETGDDKGDRNSHHEEIDRTTTFSSFVVRTTIAAADTETDDQQVSFTALVASNGNLRQRSS